MKLNRDTIEDAAAYAIAAAIILMALYADIMASLS